MQKEATRRYDANYGNFQTELYTAIRKEAYGEDFGQNSWLTAPEHDQFLQWLQLGPGQSLLDVACGSGGPALRAVEKTGCHVTGVDVHIKAIDAARSLAKQKNLEALSEFLQVNAAEPLPLQNAAFDAIFCNDAINHLPERPRILADWSRLLKPGGKMLYTNPITVTGPLTNKEIATRSLGGFYLFVPEGYDEQVIHDCGLRLLKRENVTPNMAKIAEARRAARASRETDLRAIEGDAGFEEQQEFLATASKTAKEGRLSRFAFLLEKAM